MLELAFGCLKKQREAVCQGTKLEIGWRRNICSLAVRPFHIETSSRASRDEFHVPALKEKQNTVSAVVTCSW
jgi:hypothetical protein